MRWPSASSFQSDASKTGRPSIPPERLLKAALLIAFYTVRSERLSCEQLNYDLPLLWFLDMGLDQPSFDHSSFARNRARLVKHDVAREFFGRVVAQARGLGPSRSMSHPAQGVENRSDVGRFSDDRIFPSTSIMRWPLDSKRAISGVPLTARLRARKSQNESRLKQGPLLCEPRHLGHIRGIPE